jgi:hypothetical protein
LQLFLVILIWAQVVLVDMPRARVRLDDTPRMQVLLVGKMRLAVVLLDPAVDTYLVEVNLTKKSNVCWTYSGDIQKHNRGLFLYLNRPGVSIF